MHVSQRWLGVAVAVAACGDDGGEPVDVNGTDGDCLFDDQDGRSGLRYQCAGDIEIDVVVEGPFDDSPVTSSMRLLGM